MSRATRPWLASALGAALLVFGSAGAETAADEARYHDLIEELRCLVCQNQTIAESNAPLARDLREQVRAQIAAGRSDTEILDYMTARYGDFVRYRPPLKGYTLVLWLSPALMLALGLLMLWRFRRRPTEANTAVPAVTADELKHRLGSGDES